MHAIDAETFADRFDRIDDRRTRMVRHGRTARREAAVLATIRRTEFA